MSAAEILKFLHVLAAIVWVGGGAMLQFLLFRAKRVGPDAVASMNQSAEWTSNHVFMPASFAALGFGIWLTIVGGYSFGDLWITLGFVGFGLSAVNGMAVLGPTAKKMKELGAERGPQDPAFLKMARRLDVAGRVDLLILVAVVFDMIVKPGL